MKYRTAAAFTMVVLFLISQCVIIGGMALSSAQTAGELDKAKADYAQLQNESRAQANDAFYRGAYFLCLFAYQDSGYPPELIISTCNSFVAKQRELNAHDADTPGYAP